MSALESTRDRPASLMTKPDSPMKPATPNPLKVNITVRNRPVSLMTKPDSPMKSATPNPFKVNITQWY